MAPIAIEPQKMEPPSKSAPFPCKCLAAASLVALCAIVLWKGDMSVYELSRESLEAESGLSKRFLGQDNATIPHRGVQAIGHVQRQALWVVSHEWSNAIQIGMMPLMLSAVRNRMPVKIIFTGPDATAMRDFKLPGVEIHHCDNASAIHSVSTGKKIGSYIQHGSLWAYSHHVVLWFWQAVGRAARWRHVWIIEADVRASGNISKLWELDPSFDFITAKPLEPVVGSWISQTLEGTLADIGRDESRVQKAMKQFLRLSSRYLDYVCDEAAKGNDAQDEAFLSMHAVNGGFSISDLRNFTHPDFHWNANAGWSQGRDYGKALTEDPAGAGPLVLYHPIKGRRRRQLRSLLRRLLDGLGWGSESS